MSNKNDYLPTKYWFENGTLHKAFFEYEEWAENPRDFSEPLSVIVNASKYGLCGQSDIKCNDIEEWLISETGINEEWYWNNRKRYGGIEGLISKFIKEKCVAFEYLTVYDHSGITVSCGYCRGWDYSNIGFVYVPKDSDEVKDYRKGHTKKETEEWASKNIHAEIHELDQWCRGDVYCMVEEAYDDEAQEWEMTDSLGMIWLDDETCQKEEEDAIGYIKDYFSGKAELFDEEIINKALKSNTLDLLQGQKAFDFMEVSV